MSKTGRPSVGNQSGFNLAELVVAVGIGSIVIGVAAMTLAQVYKDMGRAAADTDMVVSGARIRQAVTANQSTLSTSSCSSVLSLDTAQNTVVTFASATSITTPLQIAVSSSGLTFKKDAIIPGAPAVQVCKMYLDNFVYVGTVGTNATFLATLFFSGGAKGSVNCDARRPVEVTNITIEASTATGAVTGCNAKTSIASPQTSCESISDMHWNSVSEKCTHVLGTEHTSFSFDKCPPGMVGTPPDACRAMPTMCASGQVARSYKLGLMADCVAPHTPLAALSLRPTVSLTAAPGDDVPIPVTGPTVVTYSPPPAGAPASTIASASAAPAASCTNGTAVGVVSVNACLNLLSLSGYGIFVGSMTCDWSSLTDPAAASIPIADSNCTNRLPANYTTPNLSVVTPDPVAPADLSCQCNSRRIANGEFCVYCIPDVDIGFGVAQNTYGGNQCQSGNLVPYSGALAPGASCSGSYQRASFDGVRFSPYTEQP